jgi:hypothetical protein
VKRIEIIANRSVEDYIMDILEKADISAYTKIPIIYGRGNTNPKMGTSVWPEENFMLIIYTDDARAEKLKNLIKEFKGKFTEEGIKFFEVGCLQSV